MADSDLSLADFCPARKLPELYPDLFPSQYAVDWLIRHRIEKGYDGIFTKPGKQWLCNTRALASRMAEKAA